MHCFNAGPFTPDAKRMLAMNTTFALVLTVFLVSGEPVDMVTGVYGSMKECMVLRDPLIISPKRNHV